MGKSSKKGRITGEQRKQMNNRVVQEVMDEDYDDVVFGRVLRHLGAGHVRVMLADKKEGIAKIRTALTRRGSTPITTDDIVILTGRDFETAADTKLRFDLLAVMTRSDAARLEKEGRIPPWFLQSAETMEKGGEEEDVFDYTTHKEVEEEDVDIDTI